MKREEIYAMSPITHLTDPRSTQYVHLNELVKRIKKAVCSFYEIYPPYLERRCRKSEVAKARQICVFLVKSMTGTTYQAIVEYFPVYHRSDAIRAYKKFKYYLEKDMYDARSEISQIQNKL